MPALGQPAPEFALPSANGTHYRLSLLTGRIVVLAFYRGDDTPTCSRQLVEYSALYDELRSQDVELLGISPDSTQSHFAFGCRLELSFPLLADTDWVAAKAYGVTSLITGYGRAVFVIDGNGVLRAAIRPSMGGLLTYPSADEIRAALPL
jgi:peroxiredoxin Q/BCP